MPHSEFSSEESLRFPLEPQLVVLVPEFLSAQDVGTPEPAVGRGTSVDPSHDGLHLERVYFVEP